MATRARVIAEAKKHDAELITDSDFSMGEVIAPKGWVWGSNGCRSFCVNCGYRGEMPWVYDELLDGMQCGLVEAL